MNTTSSASSIRDTVRDTANDARDGLHEMGKAASAAAGDLQKDLQALRDDLARLAEQLAAVVSDKGNTAWKRAKSNVDSVVSDAQSKGQDAADAMREVSDTVLEAIDDSIKQRPFTTLAIAAGLGFLFGAAWRR